MNEISDAIKDIENKYGRSKANSSKKKGALFNKERDESHQPHLLPEELYMMHGDKEGREIIDVPVGPMRQLKPAPGFSFMAT